MAQCAAAQDCLAGDAGQRTMTWRGCDLTGAELVLSQGDIAARGVGFPVAASLARVRVLPRPSRDRSAWFVSCHRHMPTTTHMAHWSLIIPHLNLQE